MRAVYPLLMILFMNSLLYIPLSSCNQSINYRHHPIDVDHTSWCWINHDRMNRIDSSHGGQEIICIQYQSDDSSIYPLSRSQRKDSIIIWGNDSGYIEVIILCYSMNILHDPNESCHPTAYDFIKFSNRHHELLLIHCCIFHSVR